MTTKTDSPHHQFVDFFCKEYKKATGVDYYVQGGKDGSAVKALIKNFDVPILKVAVRAMLADDWGRPNASIAFLLSTINKWKLAGVQKKHDEAHAHIIATEKRLAKENELAKKIAVSCETPLDRQIKAMGAWWKSLPDWKKRQWFETYEGVLGARPSEEPTKTWAWNHDPTGKEEWEQA